jgi:hypothetical protein
MLKLPTGGYSIVVTDIEGKKIFNEQNIGDYLILTQRGEEFKTGYSNNNMARQLGMLEFARQLIIREIIRREN